VRREIGIAAHIASATADQRSSAHCEPPRIAVPRARRASSRCAQTRAVATFARDARDRLRMRPRVRDGRRGHAGGTSMRAAVRAATRFFFPQVVDSEKNRD